MKITRKKPLAKEWFTGLGLGWQRAPLWCARPGLAFFRGHRQMNKLTASIGAFALLTFTHVPSWAGDLTIPHDFVSGTPAGAGEVNENFDAVETAVDDNDARITTNEADITTNKADIATNKGDIAANKGNITNLQTGLGANAVTVNCGTDTIGDVLAAATPGGRLTITINGTCTENVTIERNKVTLQGGSGGGVTGTITIPSARWVVIKKLTVTGPGAGISGFENASFTVEESTIDANGTDGIQVHDGANANILNNTITNNGQASLPDSGRGVVLGDGASADIRNNTIEDNRSDGIGVFNGAFARIEQNTIQRNGRAAVFESGIQVSRALVRANGNVIRNNGYAGVEVFNSGDYRTGTFLSLADNPDNLFPFEVIDQSGAGGLAVELGRKSFVDLRQVTVTGNIDVYAQAILQVRGDDIGNNQPCSTVAGTVSVFGPNSVAQLRAVNVTTVFFDPTRGNFITGSLPAVCP